MENGEDWVGFAGSLCDSKTIDETVRNPLIRKYLREFMDKEITPILRKIEEMNSEEYKDSLVGRFSYRKIKDI